MKSRKHYKNRGFGDTTPKEGKTCKLRKVSVCFDKARDFRTKIPLFGLRGPKNAFSLLRALGGGGAMGRFTGFLRPMPETTVFLVVSGTYTGMVLPHVPENTSFIVVSGT